MNDIAREYEFIGSVGDVSIQTDLLTMLLNMHDYNHQNGTHRALFRVEEVRFQKFIDEGLHSHAYYDMPRSQPTLREILSNLAVLIIPNLIQAHLENFFPCLVIFHGESKIGSVRQIHVFLPESETHTRTYVLMYGKPKHPIFRLATQNILALAGTVIEQDTDILTKIYSNAPRLIKLNNEVGMDWVRRNFASFPEPGSPNLSKDYTHTAPR